MTPLLIGGILELGREVIRRAIPDPAARAQAELELLRMEQEGQFRHMDVQMRAIVEEAKSADPWTSRARPSFLYVFYAIILGMSLFAPIIGVFFPESMDLFFANVGKGFTAIPEELWWTFTVGYLGYAGMRSYDKQSRIKS